MTRLSEAASTAPGAAIEGPGGVAREGVLRRGCVTLGSTLIEDAFRCGRRMIHEDIVIAGSQVTNSSHVKTNDALLDERHDEADERHGYWGVGVPTGSARGFSSCSGDLCMGPAAGLPLRPAVLK